MNNNNAGKRAAALFVSLLLVMLNACSDDDEFACTISVGIAQGCTNTTPTNCEQTLNGTPHPGQSCADLGFTSS